MFLSAFVNKYGNDNDSQAEDNVSDFVAIAFCDFGNLSRGGSSGNLSVDGIADKGEHDVPNAGSKCGVEQEVGKAHACQSGRDADELAYGGNEAAKESRGVTGLAEVFYGMFHLGAGIQTHVSETTVCELINNGSSQPFGKEVVDECTEVGTDGGYDDDEENVHRTVCQHGKKGSRGNDYVGREGVV